VETDVNQLDLVVFCVAVAKQYPGSISFVLALNPANFFKWPDFLLCARFCV
jgi:hypothetical protein